MKLRKMIVFVLVVSSIIFMGYASGYCAIFDVDKGETGFEKFTDGIDAALYKTTAPTKEYLQKRNADVYFLAGLFQGYDNNVDLDPRRKHDGFWENSLSTEFIFHQTDTLRFRAGNYTTDRLYYNVNTANLLDVYNNFTVEKDLFDKKAILGGGYVFDLLYMPCNDMQSYYGHQAETFIKHFLGDFCYQKATYSFLLKYFKKHKTFDAFGTYGANHRQDWRHTISYEAGLTLKNIGILKTEFRVYRNTSNYSFTNLYDYWSYLRIKPSLLLKVTNKLSINGSYYFERKRYDDRLCTEDLTHVYDATNGFDATLMYNLTKSTMFSFSWSYIENLSNEPRQKYSGSTFMAGIYYSF